MRFAGQAVALRVVVDHRSSPLTDVPVSGAWRTEMPTMKDIAIGKMKKEQSFDASQARL